MELINFILNSLNPYLYIEYTFAIILVTQLVKKAFNEVNWHPKWTTFWVTFVLGVLGAIIKLSVQHDQIDAFKLINSFAIACLAYDYVVKVFIDWIKPK